MFKAITLRIPWLALLLCGLVLAAALDKSPDPPAIKPHADDKAIAAVAHFAPVTAGRQVWSVNAPVSDFAVQWLGINSSVGGRYLLHGFTYFLQATDPSPPRLLVTAGKTEAASRKIDGRLLGNIEGRDRPFAGS